MRGIDLNTIGSKVLVCILKAKYKEWHHFFFSVVTGWKFATPLVDSRPMSKRI